MEVLAKRLGLTIVRVPDRDGLGFDGMAFDGTVFVACGYEPRVQMTLAHEVFELVLQGELPWREALCQRGAAALLVPATAYAVSWERCRGDLAQLKAEWPIASWEVLATRAAEVFPGVVASRWFKGELQWRRGADPSGPLSPAEIAASSGCRGVGRAEVAHGGHVARSWCTSSTREGYAAIVLRMPRTA